MFPWSSVYHTFLSPYAKFVKEGVAEVSIGNVVIILLLYADNVVLFANTLEDAQKLMKSIQSLVPITLKKLCL